MPGVDAVVAGIAVERLERVVHLAVAAAEHRRADAAAEQRVAGEQAVLENIADRPRRVPGGVDDVKLERVDLVLAVPLELELRRPHRTRVVRHHRGEQVALDEHMGVVLVDADNGVRRAQVLERKDVVDVSVREQNQAQRRLLLEQRVLDDQQIPARVDDGGRAACAVLEDVAVCIQPADHKAGDDIIDHMRLLLPSENGSLP